MHHNIAIILRQFNSFIVLVPEEDFVIEILKIEFLFLL